MRIRSILLLCALFQYALAQVGFGHSYLRNSRLCHQWNCLNVKLGLADELPARERYEAAVSPLLPAGWRGAGRAAIDACYANRTRRYTNTCPGQAIMHCLVDNLITNCPEDKWRKEDGCAPVTSLAANKYMFSQSRYTDLQGNLPFERRPSWFLQHYFNSKCCQLPELFNATVLSECGFESFMLYHMHDAQTDTHLMFDRVPGITSNHLRAIASHIIPERNGKPSDGSTSKPGSIGGIEENEAINDPLDCCDMSGFIAPEWRADCGFRLSWDARERLVIGEESTEADYSTTEAVKINKGTDIKIVPLTCEQETCVFKKLGVVSESGAVDSLAFSRLLDNITRDGRWSRAKARVDTKCLTKPIADYEADCEINKLLACTLDVLTENCPDAKKEDPCKHSAGLQKNITCQISSSKFRPRNRRQFREVPAFVSREVLKECNVESLVRIENAPEPPAPKHGWTDGRKCKEERTSTTCLMKKMGVLNAYNFIDYFRMKDRLHEFCQGAWYPMRRTYAAAFSSAPLYREHCGSQQKLLNVIDTMLVTCPISKRRQGANCKRIFSELSATLPHRQRINNDTLEELLRRFQHVFLPGQVPHVKPAESVVDKPLFNFGIFGSQDEPPVRIIDVKPTSIPSEKPLVLLPVYKRMQNGRPFNNDGIWRGARL